MNCLRSISGIAALLLSAVASAQTIPDNPAPAASTLPPVLQNVGFEPQLNARLPLDLAFRDEVGGNVQLRDYFKQKPVVLALVYYGCPMLCNQVEQGVVDMLLGLVDASVGKIGTPIDRALLFCYQYDPATARYSTSILAMIRLGGVMTVVCLAVAIFIFRRRDSNAERTRFQGAP